MKREIRIAAVFAALILMIGMLFGCGKNGTAETTAPVQPEDNTKPMAAETQPQEQTETQPVVTEPPETEPKETEFVPIPVEFSSKDRYEINIFLSNFSEQSFREDYRWDPNADTGAFSSKDADIAEILSFVWLNAKFNRGRDVEDVIRDGEYYYGITLDLISSQSERFFGRTISGDDVRAAGGDFKLIDGYVCRPMADGDSYTNLTVVDRVYDLGDGTLQAEFTIYAPSEEGWDKVEIGGVISNKELYYSTPEQMEANVDFEEHLYGVAVVRPKTLANGRESYELVTYDIFE